MAPEALNDLLNAVAPARRQFLKAILTGTAFAAPLMASFSMDGLSVDPAAAQPSDSALICSNQTVVPFTMEPLSCSNMSSWGRHPRWKATLRDTSNNRKRGEAEFEFDAQKCVLEYELRVDGHLVTVNYGCIGVPSAVLVAEVGLIKVPYVVVEYVLGEGEGEIGVAVGGVFSMESLLMALQNGQAEVVVKTGKFEASGVVNPA